MVYTPYHTWVTTVPILVFLGLSVYDLGPMYATDRQTSDAHHCLMPRYRGRDIITEKRKQTHSGRCCCRRTWGNFNNVFCISNCTNSPSRRMITTCRSLNSAKSLLQLHYNYLSSLSITITVTISVKIQLKFSC